MANTSVVERDRVSRAEPRARRRAPRHLALLVAAFVLATASFVGATIYADSRLSRLTQESHALSENAIPSIIQLGVMRYELAQIHFVMNESAEGDADAPPALPGHKQAL